MAVGTQTHGTSADDATPVKEAKGKAPMVALNTSCLFLEWMPPEMILQIADYLDYSSATLLRLTCKSLFAIVPPARLLPTPSEQLQILRAFPPRPHPSDSRASLVLCEDCLCWHSQHHTVIFPNPYPERHHASLDDFLARPRKCARFALRHGLWELGGRIGWDGRHTLCADCRTPRGVQSRLCAWNCERCRSCTRRKGWSAFCGACWREGDPEELTYLDVSHSHGVTQPDPFRTGWRGAIYGLGPYLPPLSRRTRVEMIRQQPMWAEVKTY